jgi:hypothetical protein
MGIGGFSRPFRPPELVNGVPQAFDLGCVVSALQAGGERLGGSVLPEATLGQVGHGWTEDEPPTSRGEAAT